MSNIHDELIRCCKSLRIASGMADRAMTMQGGTYQEYLLNLLSSEVNIRHEKAVAAKLKDCGIPYRESFESIITTDIVFPESMSFQDCINLKFFSERRNLIMIGNTGTGKTMLSICIAMEACARNTGVAFFRTTDLIRHIKAAIKTDTLDVLVKKLHKADILILDEFGYTSYDLEPSQQLFDYLSDMMAGNRQIIVLNTNKPFSKWPGIFNDRDLAALYVSRLMHHSEMILFPGRDRRMQDPAVQKAYQAMIASMQDYEDEE